MTPASGSEDRWRQFIMDLGTLDADTVETIFARHGALSVTLTDAADQALLEPAPGTTPLWDNTRIIGLFSNNADFESLRQDLRVSFDLDEAPAGRVEIVQDRPWEREWLKDFRPMAFGRRLWVCPGGYEVRAADAVIVRLDPGLAFGSGSHPTTAMCLEWLDGLDLCGKRVLDFGCGSGILSVAALLLGAESVSAIDIDDQAIAATERNAERNAVLDRLSTTTDAAAISGQHDVVVANILAAPLTEYAPPTLWIAHRRRRHCAFGYSCGAGRGFGQGL